MAVSAAGMTPVSRVQPMKESSLRVNGDVFERMDVFDRAFDQSTDELTKCLSAHPPR